LLIVDEGEDVGKEAGWPVGCPVGCTLGRGVVGSVKITGAADVGAGVGEGEGAGEGEGEGLAVFVGARVFPVVGAGEGGMGT